jgi:hypothetical protein
MRSLYVPVGTSAVNGMDHRFKVERWSANGQHIEKELAVCEDIVAARGAFRAAVEEWPEARLTLRHGIRVLAEHPEPERAR